VRIRKNKTKLLFGLILAGFGILAWLSFVEDRNLVESARWVEHSHAVLEQSAGLREHVRDVGVTRSSYAINGDAALLVRFEKAARDAQEHLAALQRLTADNSEAQEKLRTAEELIQSRIRVSRESMEMRRKNGAEESSESRYREQSLLLGDKINGALHQFEEMERRLRDQRVAEASRRMHSANRMDLSIVLATFTALLLALWLQSREETARRRAQEEREKVVQELSKALANVKTLSEMLPSCSSCRKIRDDKGYWSQIEEYVRKHTDTEFTHGICPDCVRTLYPEVADTIEERLKKSREKEEQKTR